MPELFTSDSLGTLTGATAATIFIVLFLKQTAALKRFPARWLTLAVAEGVMMANSLAEGRLTAKEFFLCLLNGLLVTVSALGWQEIRNYLLKN